MSKWKSVDVAPVHVEVLIFDGTDVCTATNKGEEWFYTSGTGWAYDHRGEPRKLAIPPTHWQDLPEPP